MNRALWPALVGVLIAITITTTMDATGLTLFSALPLFPLAGLFWYLQKFNRQEMGLTWGNLQSYGVALLYPLLVLGLITLIAWTQGVIDTSEANWREVMLNIAAGSSIGIIMGLITEEGFFRGWLWATLKRAGQTDVQTVIWTSLAFTLWHISAVTIDTDFGFALPAGEIPIYLVNVILLGAAWGMLRMISGSVIVPSVCHSVWNAIVYPLFAFGEKTGALGIEQTHIYGPEVGLLGVLLNGLFVLALWFWIVRQRR